MAMHQIEKNAHAHAMRGIDESLEIVRRSKTRADGEEVANMIAERSIIRMFLDRHQLDGIVAKCRDARQNVAREFIESRDALGLLRHSDMRFINTRAW